MEECMKTLRETLYHIMSKNDWNVTELSIQCGIPLRTLCSILNRESKDIRLSTICRISQHLEKPIASLVSVEELKKDENAEFIENIYSELRSHLMKGGVAV